MFDDVDSSDLCFIIRHNTVLEDCPRKIYAHSKILASRCPYYRTLFESGFSESEDHCAEPESFNDHQWEEQTDSDYDLADAGQTSPSPCGTPELAEDGEMEDFRAGVRDSFAYSSFTMTVLKDRSPAQPSPASDGKEPKGEMIVSKKYRNIYIMDSSYRTYRALLYYLYTGCIAFAPLRSVYNAAKDAAISAAPEGQFPSRADYNSENALVISPGGGRENVQWVSAKSMYRLCDKLDVAEVKDVAARFIRNALTPEIVIAELSSQFSSLFPEILEDQEEYLTNHWAEVCQTKSFESYMADVFGSFSEKHHQVMLKRLMATSRQSK
ncbi:hypothetical protein OE88DRAFT_1664268, partial [Heliocybe sulcata]